MRKAFSLLTIIALILTLCVSPVYANSSDSDARYRFRDGEIVKESLPDYDAQLTEEQNAARLAKNGDYSVLPGGSGKVTVAASGDDKFSRDTGVALLSSAINALPAGSKTVTLRLMDLTGEITLGDFIVLRDMASNYGLNLIICTDYIGDSGKVDLRASIQRNNMDKDFILGRDSLLESGIKSALNNSFKNHVKVISLNEREGFSGKLSTAMLLPDGMSAANLKLYRYNYDSNNYTLLNMPAHYIDSNGYLHFTLNAGGSYIISDGILGSM